MSQIERRGLAALSLFSALLLHSAWAREVPEHLVQTLPQEFALANTRTQPGMTVREYVPTSESLQTWTRQILVQKFFFKSGYPPPPGNYINYLVQSWHAACPDAPPPKIGTGYDSSGRPAGAVDLDCPRNPKTGKPEHTYFQIIRATVSLYVAQFAYRFEPTAEQKVEAVDYLRSVHIEGTSPANRPG